MAGFPSSSGTACRSRTRPGAGGFPPQDEGRERALEGTIRRSPEQFGVARSRWTLALLRQHCPDLAGLAHDGCAWWRLERWGIRLKRWGIRLKRWGIRLKRWGIRLKRWGIRLKRGRLRLTSPDPDYAAKRDAVGAARDLARGRPGEVRLLYADEAGMYRQPLCAAAWHGRGRGAGQPTSPRRTCRTGATRSAG
jgi:hypothetical protein